MTYPPPARPLPAWLPAALMGVLALVGLGCTLLPLWTMAVNPADFRPDLGGIDPDAVDSTLDITVGFYDWGAASANSAAIAMIPIALAVAVAIAVTLAARGSDRTLWGAAAATALSSLVLSIAVVLQPATDIEITGPLGRELRPSDLGSLDAGADLDVGYGAGLIVAVVALVLVLGVATWQYFVSGRPKRQQWYPQPPQAYPPQPYPYA